MNIILDLTDDEIKQLRGRLNKKPVIEQLLKKFEIAVSRGEFFNWIEITDSNIPDGVIFGCFSNDPMAIPATHYFKPLEVN